MPKSPKWFLSLRFPNQNPVRTFLTPHTCHAPCPSPSSWFGHPNNMWWGIRTIKLLVMQSFPLSCHPVPLRPNAFCSTLFSNTFTLHSSLNVRNQASHPCKSGKILVVNNVIFIFLETKLEDKTVCFELWQKFFDYICLVMKRKQNWTHVTVLRQYSLSI
jgi:hypothetical protein